MARVAITAIELVNLGPFRGPHRFEVLAEGLSVLVRPNESGKSTLLEAVPAVLWGETKLARHWQAGDKEPAAAAVEFRRDDARAAEHFRVERDYGTHQVAAWQIKPDGTRRRSFAARTTRRPHGRSAPLA